MALDRCTECETIEGKWRVPNLAERQYVDFDFDAYTREDMVCCECGAIGSWQGIPEHDDLEDR